MTQLSQPVCDYAKYPHSGGGTDHGPAVLNKGGYNICQKCYDAMMEAYRQEDSYYKKQQEEWIINERSRALQRKCFL